MKTSIDLFDAMSRLLRKICSQPDFVFNQKDGGIAHPVVYPFTLPPKNKDEKSDNPLPYVVLKFPHEEQIMLRATDESKLTFIVFLGVYNPAMDWSLGLRDVAIGLERLDNAIKDEHLLDGIGELNSVKKTIPDEQPFPYFEGALELVYTYYKPVKLIDP